MSRTNDPLGDIIREARREALRDAVQMFEDAQKISCGCPESRLCNHETEIDAYQTAAGMLEDLLDSKEYK